MSSKGMNVLSKRLQSFRPKRRPSAGAGSKLVSTKWPHDQPSPTKLADAGFYFNPTEDHPDNVTCYLCDKDLDGWEAQDDPSVEHLKHCPDCGWARVAVTRAAEDDRSHAEDPQGTVMVEARLSTFGKKWWPHEEKKGWLPKMEKMAEAGWYYAPTKESNDYAMCAYCELSLDGWEDTDNPWEEHIRRSPSCIFFNWKGPPAVKRPTKKTRASLQSANSAPSIYGEDDDLPPPKKTSRAKKAKKVEVPPSPPPAPAPEPARGRKRPSTAAQQGPVIMYDGGKDSSEEEAHPPPPKKRATRASLAQQQPTLPAPATDRTMADDSDAASTASRISVKPKKKPTGGRRVSKARAPSRSRATARKPVPDPTSDSDLDRHLAADLDRPLTDEENNFKDFAKPFIRSPTKRLTRSRASLAVEASAKDAPEGVLIHTSTAARRGRSRTPGADAERRQQSPLKFYGGGSKQEYELPVRVPKHLAPEESDEDLKSQERRKQEDEVAETIVAAFSAEDEPEVQIKVKKKPGKKGKKKEEEAPPKKKGRAAKKEKVPVPVPVRSRSGTAESRAASFVAVEVRSPEVQMTKMYEPSGEPELEMPQYEIAPEQQQDGEPEEVAPAQQEPEEVAPEKPARARKGKLVKGTNPRRTRASGLSVAETAPEAEADEPEASDAGSIIHHDISVPYPVLPTTSDAEPPAPTPPKRIKRTTKKITAAGTRKATRSSILSQATSATGSMVNSGDDSDAGSTAAKKPSKHQLKHQRTVEDLRQRAEIEDLRQRSESFFNSAQNEELELSRARKASAPVSPPPAVGNGDDTEPDDGDDVQMVGTTTNNESRIVSWAENDNRAQSPINIPASPARRPLSPVRSAANIPLSPGKVRSSRAPAWTAVDLDAVLDGGEMDDEEEMAEGEVLTEKEKGMTVEEWVKWSAAQAEWRVSREAERIIAMFEREGRRAVEAVEGMEVVD